MTANCAGCGKPMQTELSAGQAMCHPCRRHRPLPNTCRRCGKPARRDYCTRDCWSKRAGGTPRATGRTCEICQTPYRATHADQRTCGRACGVTLQRTITKTLPAQHATPVKTNWSAVRYTNCPYCKTVFATQASNLRPYCSNISCKRDHANAAQLREYHSNPDRKATVLAQAHRRRASMFNQWIEDVDPRIVYERDQWTCHLCGQAVDRSGKRGPWMPSLDHVTPISLGGLHSYANTACSHYRCNLSKGNRTTQ